MNELIIGIDGGGTHTRAQLADLRGNLLGAGQAGTSNPLVHGMAAAQHELSLAVTRAFAAAHLEPARVAALSMGLGGAGRSQEQVELEEWARSALADRVAVVNDGQIVLAAGIRDNWGIALIAGTGSLAWGRNRAGETARAGGWGYLMGDEGSSFDLARQALRAATQAADGRGAPTRLLQAVLDYWDLSAPIDLIARVYRSGLTHSEIAQLAPAVIQAAEAGDGVARRLVGEAAYDLARAAAAVARKLNLTADPIPLALTGGLLLGSFLVRTLLLTSLNELDCPASSIELVQEPVAGAVRLALELARQN